MIILYITLFIIASVSYGIMWTLQFRFYRSVFFSLENEQFWNPKLSWKNKWKLKEGRMVEKFPFSSTFLVFLTDAFHLFQFFFLNSIIILISLLVSQLYEINIIIMFVGIRTLFGLIFTVLFDRILMNKD
jgi:hypothetical protein